jgi:hypothetical protein
MLVSLGKREYPVGGKDLLGKLTLEVFCEEECYRGFKKLKGRSVHFILY